MDQLTVGVFRLGQIWSVVGGEQLARGFMSREAALDAAHELVAARRAGQDAQILAQDELGLLTNIRPSNG
jgi:hypothetical protein